jgi:DNA polymerase elongation subunit (family B)
MNKNNISKVIEFLKEKPGYIKEPPARLSDAINRHYGFKPSSEESRVALRQARKEARDLVSPKTDRPIKRLFFDIETSYNIVKSWRIGYNININPSDIIHERAIICLSYKWEGEDTVHTLTWNKGNDKRIIEQFVELLKDASEVVGHNLDKFDLKWVVTRAAFHGILALPKYQSYDTLKKARSHFNFNSNKLDYVAKFLGLDGKRDYRGKYSGTEMWDKIILENNQEALREMVLYCEQDVILTEEVYNKLRPYTEASVHHGVLQGNGPCSCPNCAATNVALEKTMVTRAGTIKRLMGCGECETKFFISNTRYLNLIKADNG